MKDHAVCAELVGRFEITGERALGTLAQRRIVAGEVDQVDGVKVDGRVAVFRGGLFERRISIRLELRRAPETGRGGMDLDRLGTHRLRALEGEVEAPGRIDVRSKQWHCNQSKAGPFWHAQYRHGDLR